MVKYLSRLVLDTNNAKKGSLEPFFIAYSKQLNFKALH
jgi:hypothetical protein